MEELKQDEFFKEMNLLHYVSKLLALFELRTTIGDALVTFPDFDWLPIKREFNLQDDTYEATFRSSVRAMYIAIAESVTINNILFILNPALVLAYRNVVEIKFPKLVGMLHKQFPKTTLERVSTVHYFFFIILPTKNKPTHYLRQRSWGGIVFTPVCLFVCVFVCPFV